MFNYIRICKMGKKKPNTAKKIKAAAKKLFTEKGFGRTTTRDIATQAGVNLALVNYHFRSKEELFRSIIMEVVQGFVSNLQVLLNDDLSFDWKVDLLVHNYIVLLNDQPDLPIFMLSEMRNHPDQFVERMGLVQTFRESRFFSELAERCPDGISPVQFFINLLSLSVFPFIAKPIITKVMGLEDKQFDLAMEARKELIPIWFKSMLQPQNKGQ